MKKKLATILIAVLMAVAFTGCNMFAWNEDAGNDTGDVLTPVEPPLTPVDPPEAPLNPNEKVFTVTVSLDGKLVAPGTSAQARWTQVDRNGNILSIPVSANFNSMGVAQTSGLDGNYRVTLINLPGGYTYDPNIYVVDSDERDVEIELYALNATKNTGSNWYSDRINIASGGTYRVTLKSADDLVRFQYQPTANGIYHIESYVDIYTNEVNPVMQRHSGNGAMIYETPVLEVINSGGSYGSFTKNFVYTFMLSQESVRGAMYFSVRADAKVSYPVTVDLRVWYEKPYEAPDNPDYYPTEFDDVIKDSEVEAIRNKYVGEELEQKLAEYYQTHIYTKAQKTAYTANLMKAGGSVLTPLYDSNHHFSTKVFKFFDKSEDIDGDGIGDGDGYYHVWDEATKTYGAVICATLTIDRFCMSTETGTAFLDGKISCNYINGMDYSLCIKGVKTNTQGTVLATLADSYSAYVTDGLYPVTQELREFLQAFASSRGYFQDGDGFLESGSGTTYSASEDAMWLFACGYYA